MAKKRKGCGNYFFNPSLLLLFWIRDPGSEIRDPAWVKIRIRDPGFRDKHPGSATLVQLFVDFPFKNSTGKHRIYLLLLFILRR